MREILNKVRRESQSELDRVEISSLPSVNMGARAAIVNRTHRIVRERAQQMSARRSRVRSLWLPLAVCGSLLVILVTAVWSMLDQYELNPTGMPDASDQFAVLLLWFLPVSGLLLAMVWLRRNSNRRSGNGVVR